MSEAWQGNWDVFLDRLSNCVLSHDISATLAQNFAGRSVKWTGILDDKNLEEPPPLVEIAFEEREIDLGGGRSAIIDGFSLALAKDSVSDWDDVDVGTQVTFTAQFETASSPFSPIEVVHLNSGESVILIGLTNGRLAKSEPAARGLGN